MTRVLLVFRRPIPGHHYSIEKVFCSLLPSLNNALRVDKYELPFESRGLLPRLKNIVYLSRIAREYDIVHITGDVHYCSILKLINRNALWILTIHDCGGLRALRGIKRVLLKWIWFEIPIALSDCVTAVTGATCIELRECTMSNLRRLTVIHNPVEVNTKPDGMRNPSRVLQIGTKTNKNIDRLTEALSGLDCELAIVGPTTSEERIRWGSRCKTVYMEGLSDAALEREYAASGIVSVVSTYEGFGLPVLEGILHGCRVVASRLPPIKEIAGDIPYYCDPYDPNSIRLAFSNAFKRYSEKVEVHRVAEEFSVARKAKSYRALYDSLINYRNEGSDFKQCI